MADRTPAPSRRTLLTGAVAAATLPLGAGGARAQTAETAGISRAVDVVIES